MGDATRARTLSRLLDGRHYTATELAQHAGVTLSTMSAHLKLMVDEHLIKVRAQGRHRYFTLADGNVAHALEALLRVAEAYLRTLRAGRARIGTACVMRARATGIWRVSWG